MRRHYLRYIPVLAGLFIVVAVMSVVVYLVMGFMHSKPATTKQFVQQITLLQPPPPPPPPVQKPPPPEVKQEVNVPKPDDTPKDTPDPADNLPPIDDNLGLDAAGGAGTDGFGLVGKKGGADLIGSGGGRFRWYINVIQSDISSALSDVEDIRKDRYTAVVRLWIGKGGEVNRVELVQSTGKHALDKKLQVALSDVRHISEAPPEELPQPIELRIHSRL